MALAFLGASILLAISANVEAFAKSDVLKNVALGIFFLGFACMCFSFNIVNVQSYRDSRIRTLEKGLEGLVTLEYFHSVSLLEKEDRIVQDLSLKAKEQIVDAQRCVDYPFRVPNSHLLRFLYNIKINEPAPCTA